MSVQPAFIADLEATAGAAQRAEIAFRDSISVELARHERERQFAFRRVALARRMADAALGAEDLEKARAAQIAALKSELGWHADTPQRQSIYEAWLGVCDAVWAACRRPEGDETPGGRSAGVAEALAAFEAWYEAEYGSSFLVILDVEIPEMPVVEF